MSSFILSGDAIREITDVLAESLPDNTPIYGFRAPQSTREAFRECRNSYGAFDRKMIYNRLFRLNVAAYNARYDETDTVFTPFECAANRHRGDKVRAYKQLMCFLYQCAEGDIDRSDLYLALEDFKGALAHNIVSCMPQYRECDAWG